MVLTAKQQKRLKEASLAQRPNLRRLYNNQNSQARTRGNAQTRSQRPLAARAKATNQVARRPSMNPIPRSLKTPFGWAFNAFDKRHMPLDEVTAPYNVSNLLTTLEFSSSETLDKIIVIAPRMIHRQETYLGPMTDYIAVVHDASSVIQKHIPLLNYARSQIAGTPQYPSSGIEYDSMRVRLHNLSASVECLGTSNALYPPGSLYVGTVPSMESGEFSEGMTGTGSAASTKTLKERWAQNPISTGFLRSVTAASLMGQPVTVHSAINENVPYKSWMDLCNPSIVGTASGSCHPPGAQWFYPGLEPIVIYLPKCGSIGSLVNYRVTIAQQWCTRHADNVLLRSKQEQHPPTAPSVWHHAVTAVKDVGQLVVERAGGPAGIAHAAASLLSASYNPTASALSLMPLGA